MSEQNQVTAVLDAPCVFCRHSGSGYWQRGTHAADCPWFDVGGFDDRAASFRSVLLQMVERVRELETAEAERICLGADDPEETKP